MRGATSEFRERCSGFRVSIHAPHAGRDKVFQDFPQDLCCFNPRAPCGARREEYIRECIIALVSIHAPHAGRDNCRSRDIKTSKCFNPRAPCGARHRQLRDHLQEKEFQSTRPMRGATANEVTTSLFCHIFMGVTRHKYDFLGILPHAPPPAWFAYLYFFATFSVHFTFALQKNAQMIMADSRS